MRGRRWTAGGLAGLAVLLAVLALVLSYLGRAVLRADAFADRAVAALRDPAVQDDLADHLTAAITQAGGGDLVSVRPLIRPLAGGIVGSPAFAALFRRAALEAHSVIVEGRRGTVLLTVSDVGVLVQGALERLAPGVATTIGAERASTLLASRPGGGVLDAVRTAKRVYAGTWVVALLAVLAAAAALAVSPARRRTARRLGLGLAASGLAIAGLVTIGRAIAVQAASPGRGAAVGAVWTAFLGGLRAQALILAVGGAVCVACAGGRSARPGASLRPRVAVSLGLIAGGVLIVLEPVAVLTIAAQAAGLYVLYLGVAGVLAAVAERSPTPNPAASWALASRARRLLPVALAAAALAAVALVLVTGGEDEAPAATPLTCNGYRVLCNRALNDVALAATHNSMASTTIPHWLFAQQDGSIADQLNEGIHGLLIDTYDGFQEGGRVRTDLSRVSKIKALEQEIGAPAVEAALRIRARMGPPPGGRPGIFLCHGFCELGAITLSSALDDIRSFLVTHPADVVVIINQDEGVTPTDIERAFGQAGLLDLVYRGPLGPFPKLRAMIDSNQRLVVLAENDAGDVPWYHLAYAHALQETPFSFRSPGLLADSANLEASCRPNRGPSTAPLFLLNHWIDTTPTPRPSLARIVNARAALLTRARTCERIRHRLPNLVAVDFYREGDLLGVVNALNGIGR